MINLINSPLLLPFDGRSSVSPGYLEWATAVFVSVDCILSVTDLGSYNTNTQKPGPRQGLCRKIPLGSPFQSFQQGTHPPETVGWVGLFRFLD